MTAAESRVAVLLALMRQLQEVMRAENGLLRDLKLTRLRELQGEKAALAGRYELELRRLRQTPDTLAGLGEEGRRLLESSMREFQTTVRSNADRLLQARAVVEAVVQTIGHSLAADGTSARYAPGAQAAGDAGARVIPVAFDRRC
jgi:hypothetical protein